MAGKMLHGYEESLARAKDIEHLGDTRQDIIHMALETSYRDRMKQMYELVKRRLDYQVALQNARKDFERINMINWINNEVKKAITRTRYITIMFSTIETNTMSESIQLQQTFRSPPPPILVTDIEEIEISRCFIIC